MGQIPAIALSSAQDLHYDANRFTNRDRETEGLMARTTKERTKIESTLSAIVAHPIRLQCFVALTERVASPNELSAELRLNLSDVAYHVRKLAEIGVIELVDERKGLRGSNEHFYTAVKRPYSSDAEWEEMNPEERNNATRYTLQLHFADAALALNAGTFDSRTNRCLIRVALNVDEEGFDELNKLEERHYEERLEIEARSAERLRSLPAEEPIPVASTTMFFEMPRKRSC
jgi:hypothetical protein